MPLVDGGNQRGNREAPPGSRRLAGSEGDRVAANIEAWDVAVIGAGPAGSVCACSALATAPGLRVALVDMAVFPRDKACGDAIRVEAAAILRELSLGSVFNGRPIINRTLPTFPTGIRNFGLNGQFSEEQYVVEREVFDNHLFDGAVERGAADYSGHRFVDAAFDDVLGLWRLTLARRSGGSTEISCRILVGADGASSNVRRLAGVDRRQKAHTAVALRGYARAAGMDRDAIRVDFLQSLIPGYGWTFPLAGNKVNVGVIIHAREYMQSGRRLESHMDEYVEYLDDNGVEIEDLGNVRTHPLPLGSQVVPLVPRPGLALVGDAAAMINPFTGEGIHYGLWAGRALGRAIGRSLNGKPAGGTTLEGHARAYAERYAEHMKRFGTMRDMVRFRNCFR